jgi:hypothetical protein
MPPIRRLSVTTPFETPTWASDTERAELSRLVNIISAIEAVTEDEVPTLLDELGASAAIWFAAGSVAAQTLRTVLGRPDGVKLTEEESQAEDRLIAALSSVWVMGMVTGVQFALQKGLALDVAVPHY